MKASYRRTESERWQGVVKDSDGKIVWCCGHSHKCRDYNHSWRFSHEGAALYCAAEAVKNWERTGTFDGMVPA